MTYGLVGWRRRAALTAVALIGATATYLLVMLLAPRPSAAEDVAHDVLTAAAERDKRRIPGLLPDAGWADLSDPSGTIRYRADGTSETLADARLVRPGGLLVMADATDEKSGLSVSVAVPAGGSPGLAAGAAAAAVLLTAVAVATLAGIPPRTAVPAAGAPAVMPDGDSEVRRLGQQRSAMIRNLAELIPQMPEAVAWQAATILEAAGVREVRPDGARFDPALHHAVGTERAPDQQAVGVIARTVRPGYADGQRLMILPRVVVFEDEAAVPGAVA